MTIDQMLRNMHDRVSFHMPGNKMRFGDGSAWDVTELGMTDNLHHPEGPYLELGRRLAERNGAAISFPLVGGSTRGMQLMILYAARIISPHGLPASSAVSGRSPSIPFGTRR